MPDTLSYELGKTLTLIPGYDPFATAGDATFDEARAGNAIEFIESCCTHVKGELARKPFKLQPWEQAIIANLFGWRRPDGTRRYREAFVFVPRKNGKTALIAAIIVYVLYCDGEPGAEIYSAAADRDQARLVFEQVRGMVVQDSELAQHAKIYQHSVVVGGSSYKPISAEAGTKHGFNSHLVVVDELHAQPTRELVDVLATSTGARRQPLVIHITTSDFERPSICNEKHDYASKVRDGIIEDAAFLPVIYEARQTPYIEQLQSLDAVERLDIMCTCKHVSPIQLVRLWQKACAKHAITAGGNSTSQTNRSGIVPTIPLGPCVRGACAQHATSKSCSTTIQSTRQGQSPNAPSGPREISRAFEPPAIDGGQDQKTRGQSRNIDDTWSTDSRKSSTNGCETSKAELARSADEQQSYASIIATIRAQLEDCYAPPVILESVFSEILNQLYEKHSPTCDVRRAKCDGASLLIECPGDDWTDPKVWYKANPNLGVSVSEEYLARECKRAQESPSFENTFKRLHLNIRTEQDVRWLQMDRWDACDEKIDLESLKGESCWCGLDLASTQDITAFVKVFKQDDKYVVVPTFWLPRETAALRDRRDRVPYLQWMREGWIRGMEGDSIDQHVIVTDIIEDSKSYRIEEIACDRWNADMLMKDLTSENITAFIHEQSTKAMDGPSKEFEKAMLAGKLVHGRNPVLRWMASNVTVHKEAATDRIRPDKKTSTEKIDGIVAAIMAVGRAAMGEPEQPSYYETHEIEIW